MLLHRPIMGIIFYISMDAVFIKLYTSCKGRVA